MQEDRLAADEDATVQGSVAGEGRREQAEPISGLEPEFEPEFAPEEPKPPRDPVRTLLRLGWAMFAVLAVLAVLLIVGLMRISTAVNNVACIQRAQVSYSATAAPGSSSSDISLARLGLKIALNKCGR